MAQEKTFENKVKKFLEAQGAWFIKYWGGGIYTKKGIPDLLVCLNGHFIAIELKAPKEKPSELQILNLSKIHNAGGFAILLFPDQWELFKEFITEDFANYNELKARWEEWELQFKSH